MAPWVSEIREFLKILLSWPSVVLLLGLILSKPVIKLINDIKSFEIKDIVKLDRDLNKTKEIIQKVMEDREKILESLESDLYDITNRFKEARKKR